MKKTKLISLRIDEDLIKSLDGAAAQLYNHNRTLIIEGLLYEAVIGLSTGQIYVKSLAGLKKYREIVLKKRNSL